MIICKYEPEKTELKEDEWLLKIRNEGIYNYVDKTWTETGDKTGFLSKLTKKGELPVKFLGWGVSHWSLPQKAHELPIYVFKEYPRTGWKLIGWRFGQSQNWATVRHPEGFMIEIYLDNFLDVVKESTIDQGVILGKYKWENNKLIKE
jgi:hypothetical protein